MRSRLLTTAVVLLAFGVSGLTGCAAVDEGRRVTEERPITALTSVELRTDGDLVVTLGDTPALTVSAGERVIDRLTAEVDAGVLRLGMDDGPSVRDGEIRYALTVTSLESITVLGSGDASVDFSGASSPAIIVRGSGDVDAVGIDASTAVLTVEGSGEIDIQDATVGELSVRLSGSAGVTVDGTAESQDVNIDGDADYDAARLRGEAARVVIRGAGGADVTVSRALDVAIDGSGEISYGGDPLITEDISGSGELVRR